MVCLEGVTLTRLENSLSDADLKKYPLWSWLSHLLTHYIYTLEHKDKIPKVPGENERTLYAFWFKDMLKEFLKKFNDATPERVYRSLLNPPSAEIAFMTYNATSLELQRGFLGSIHIYDSTYNAPTPQHHVLQSAMLNPAEETNTPTDDDWYDASTDDSFSDNDSLPELESLAENPNKVFKGNKEEEQPKKGENSDDILDIMNTLFAPNTKCAPVAPNTKFYSSWEEFLTSGPIFTVPPVQTNKLAKQVHQDAS